jgi:hypothetical protein
VEEAAVTLRTDHAVHDVELELLVARQHGLVAGGGAAPGERKPPPGREVVEADVGAPALGIRDVVAAQGRVAADAMRRLVTALREDRHALSDTGAASGITGITILRCGTRATRSVRPPASEGSSLRTKHDAAQERT